MTDGNPSSAAFAWKLALELAEKAIGVSEPNPRVGCVIIGSDGRVIGSGHTQTVGGPHAEVVALRAVAAAGLDVRGATAYVTLEPCAHHGRTPPCCDALVAAGVAQVRVAMQDPNPLVAGRGMARLRAAGIKVELLPDADPVAAAARELNLGFLSRMQRQRPWVRVKVAASLDGYTALPDGRSQWITGAAARVDGHAWRRRAGAVLTGIGTVLADDPRLDVRLVPTLLQPLRVVLDSRLRIPTDARVLASPGTALVVANCADPERISALQAAGAEVLLQPGGGANVDLVAVLSELGQREINELHVEAGSRLNGALVAAGLVDELLLYYAPVLLGTGRSLASFAPPPTLDQAHRFRLHSLATVGSDLRLVLRAAQPATGP